MAGGRGARSVAGPDRRLKPRGAAHPASPRPGGGFHVLTVHGLSSFFLRFGLAGLAGLELPRYLGRMTPAQAGPSES